ncbi:MAG: UDP-N-acetylmuramoyl-L-alanine--D-glutamate ligase, partial [Rhodospirillaceae bacterium]
AFLIGEAAGEISKALGSMVPHTVSETLESATKEAIALSKIDPEPYTVLLSPACSSFDQFENFSDRGNEFKRLIHLALQELSD